MMSLFDVEEWLKIAGKSKSSKPKKVDPSQYKEQEKASASASIGSGGDLGGDVTPVGKTKKLKNNKGESVSETTPNLTEAIKGSDEATKKVDAATEEGSGDKGSTGESGEKDLKTDEKGEIRTKKQQKGLAALTGLFIDFLGDMKIQYESPATGKKIKPSTYFNQYAERSEYVRDMRKYRKRFALNEEGKLDPKAPFLRWLSTKGMEKAKGKGKRYIKDMIENLKKGELSDKDVMQLGKAPSGFGNSQTRKENTEKAKGKKEYIEAEKSRKEKEKENEKQKKKEEKAKQKEQQGKDEDSQKAMIQESMEKQRKEISSLSDKLKHIKKQKNLDKQDQEKAKDLAISLKKKRDDLSEYKKELKKIQIRQKNRGKSKKTASLLLAYAKHAKNPVTFLLKTAAYLSPLNKTASVGLSTEKRIEMSRIAKVLAKNIYKKALKIEKRFKDFNISI